MRKFSALFATLTALTVIICTVLFKNRDKGLDKLVDINTLFLDEVFIIIKAVITLHIHRCHIRDGFFGVIGALNTHHGNGIFVARCLRGVAGIEVALDRLPTVFLKPFVCFVFSFTVSDENIFKILAVGSFFCGCIHRSKRNGCEHNDCKQKRNEFC